MKRHLTRSSSERIGHLPELGLIAHIRASGLLLFFVAHLPSPIPLQWRPVLSLT